MKQYGDKLDHLAALYGIIKEFYDLEGVKHQIQENEMLAIFRAMGVDILSPEFPADAVAEKLNKIYGRILESVIVLEQGVDQHVTVHMPDSLRDHPLYYDIILESGEEVRNLITTGEVLGRHDIQGISHLKLEFLLHEPLPMGYHSMAVRDGHDGTLISERARLIIAPPKAHIPEDFRREQQKGLSIQLYALSSERNGGMGDFSDLRDLMEEASKRDIRTVGVNPIHALFPFEGNRFSPYYPSNRLFWNYMYVAVDEIPETSECGIDLSEENYHVPLVHNDLLNRDIIDYENVAVTRRAIFKKLFECFYENHYLKNTERAGLFRQFVEEGGEPLKRQALFDALYEYFREEFHVYDWRQWPLPYQDCESNSVEEFRLEHEKEVLFYLYLQWNVSVQLDVVRQFGRSRGISLYLDLAVGAAPSGGEVWAHQNTYTWEARIGSPPDAFSPGGQDWGLAPFFPERMKEEGYETFIRMLQSNMLEDGIVRMDHVMGLFRLYWVIGPGGSGAYVRYPFEDLLSILVLESVRRRCAVIGEDLGTVPPEVREGLKRREIFTWKVFYFERKGAIYKRAREYEINTVATINTHDLPTIIGFWNGSDIWMRKQLGIFPQEAFDDLMRQRDSEKEKIVELLVLEGLLPKDTITTGLDMRELSQAMHNFIGRSGSRFMLYSLHDLYEDAVQPNLPGTIDEYPNWSIPYTRSVGDLKDSPIWATEQRTTG